MRSLRLFVLVLVAAACATKDGPAPPPNPSDFPRRSAKIFDTRKCDPAVVQRPDPDYPDEARDQGIEGWVMLSGLIDSTGRVRDAIILAAQPEGVFDQAG